MIAKFFNKTKPINTLIVLVLLAIIFLIATFTNLNLAFNLAFFVEKLLLLLLFLISLFLINFIIRKNSLTKNNSYVLLLIILFVGMFPKSLTNTVILTAHFFILVAYRRIYSLRSVKNTKEKIFDSAFWVGIATIIYPWSFIYLSLIYAALNSFNKATLRNVIIPIVGFVTPIFIYKAYNLVVADTYSFGLNLEVNFSFLNYNALTLLTPIALIIAFLIWTVIPTTLKITTVNNEFRASWFVILLNLLISIIIIIPSPIKNGSEFLFLFFPTAVIFTNYLQRAKEKWFKEVFLYLFLAATIFVMIL